jgi:hypothetical protein
MGSAILSLSLSVNKCKIINRNYPEILIVRAFLRVRVLVISCLHFVDDWTQMKICPTKYRRLSSKKNCLNQEMDSSFQHVQIRILRNIINKWAYAVCCFQGPEIFFWTAREIWPFAIDHNFRPGEYKTWGSSGGKPIWYQTLTQLL